MLRLHGVVHPHLGLSRPALVRKVEVRKRRAVEVDDAAVLQILGRGARVVGLRKVFRRRPLRGRHALAHELENGLDNRIHSGVDRVR